ncbi:MAG: bifunctional folylpolyglutamate synthase/dihydrofolate synthase [Elusimicrobia bacterium]|nr:bifunctional folylpolyglutamate synthase/dihydrofolate synthase [Elusimicrobiota bacterium]
MDYAGALAFLEGRQETRWKLGLSRIEALLAAAGDPHDGLPAVHVAGTNGKGSFCAMLASALSGAGLKTGLYTSPHLSSPRERIRVDGRMVSEADFAALIHRLKLCEPEESTYFELVTAAAFLHFRRERVDAAVVEVGLGGRLDATNALRSPLLSVVTSIGWDHAQHLGDTLEKIAVEKAGIFKPGVPVLCGEDAPVPRAALEARARQAGAPLRSVPALVRVGEDWGAGFQDARTTGGTRLRIPLLGDPALKNAGLVVAALEALPGRGLAVRLAPALDGLSRASWPARFEVRRTADGRVRVIDGAHNEPALEAFAATWRRSPYSGGEPVFLMGTLADKDWERLAALAAPLGGRFLVAAPPSPRALPAELLAERLRACGARDVRAFSSAPEAVRSWFDDPAPSGAMIGSFYLAGMARE